MNKLKKSIMNKKDLTQASSRRSGLTPAQAHGAIEAAIDLIQAALLRGEGIYIRGLGTWIPTMCPASSRPDNLSSRPDRLIPCPASIRVRYRLPISLRRLLRTTNPNPHIPRHK